MKTLFDYDITLEEADELIKNGANVNEQHHHDQCTPIFYVKNLKIIELFIKHGANVNAKDKNGFTPLFHIRDKYVDVAKLLIKHGADVNARDNYKFSPIFYKSNIEIIELFINHGALLNIRDIYGLSPLDRIAEFEERTASAKLLIAHGAIAGTRDGYQTYRDLFTVEQQKAFDAFASITSNDNDFYKMCLAYQESIKNNIKIEINDMEIL